VKIKITFKDPDALYEKLLATARKSLEEIESTPPLSTIALRPTSLSQDEREMLTDARADVLSNRLSTWIQWGEYVTIEFDLDKKTATVLEVERANDA
jgi:hypothetical protein